MGNKIVGTYVERLLEQTFSATDAGVTDDAQRFRQEAYALAPDDPNTVRMAWESPYHDGVNGEAVVNMAQNHIVIPYAFASSDKIDVGAKGVITADERNGVLYVRFRKLHGILKINNGKRNLDVLKAREKFDQFDSESVLSGIGKTDSSTGVINEVGN